MKSQLFRYLQTPSTRTQEIIILLILLIVAAAMRFYNLAGWSLSNDELSALNRLRFDSFGEMIAQGVKLGDFHPAGVQVFLWFWTAVFGNSVWIVRLPFAFSGILAVWLVFAIGKKWFGTTTGLFASAAMAFLQYPILYSQLARPYAPGLLFSLATVWFWSNLMLTRKPSIKDFAGFVIFATLSAYTHHYSFLFAVVVGLTGLLLIEKQNLKAYLLSAVLVGILYLPHLQIFLYQFGIGGVGGDAGWLGKPEPHWIAGYLWYAFNESYFIIGFVVIVLLISVLQFKLRPCKLSAISFLWPLAMFLIGYFYSIWRNPILQYSILIFSFPFLMLFVFSFLKPKPSKFILIMILGFLTTGAISTIVGNRFYQKQHFGEFEDIATKIADWNRRFGTENITNTIVANGPFYIHYYLDRMETDVRFLQYDIRTRYDLLILSQIVDTSATDWFAHANTKPAPPEIPMVIQEKFPCLVFHKDYDGLSEIWFFGRMISDSCLRPSQPARSFSLNFDNGNLWGGNPDFLDSTTFSSSPFSYLINEKTVYGPGIKLIVGEDIPATATKVEMEISAFSHKPLQEMPVVFNIENSDGKSYFWRSMRIESFITPGKWGKAFFSSTLPENLQQGETLSIFIYNPMQETFWADDFEVRFFSKADE